MSGSGRRCPVCDAVLGAGVHEVLCGSCTRAAGFERPMLGALLPAETELVTRPRIGAADVAAIEAITEGFRRADYAHGGGLCRAAALTQLHQVRRLHDARCTSKIRTRLLVATVRRKRKVMAKDDKPKDDGKHNVGDDKQTGKDPGDINPSDYEK